MTNAPGEFSGTSNMVYFDDVVVYQNVDIESEVTDSLVASQRIVTAYNSQGLVDTVTSYRGWNTESFLTRYGRGLGSRSTHREVIPSPLLSESCQPGDGY
jgi:hypothetical protein